LVEVDFKTQTRRVKESGKLYAEICRRNLISAEMRNGVKGRSATPKKHFNLYTYGEKNNYVSSNAIPRN
jgi:hypothetical protein